MLDIQKSQKLHVWDRRDFTGEATVMLLKPVMIQQGLTLTVVLGKGLGIVYSVTKSEPSIQRGGTSVGRKHVW